MEGYGICGVGVGMDHFGTGVAFLRAGRVGFHDYITQFKLWWLGFTQSR